MLCSNHVNPSIVFEHAEVLADARIAIQNLELSVSLVLAPIHVNNARIADSMQELSRSRERNCFIFDRESQARWIHASFG